MTTLQHIVFLQPRHLSNLLPTVAMRAHGLETIPECVQLGLAVFAVQPMQQSHGARVMQTVHIGAFEITRQGHVHLRRAAVVARRSLFQTAEVAPHSRAARAVDVIASVVLAATTLAARALERRAVGDGLFEFALQLQNLSTTHLVLGDLAGLRGIDTCEADVAGGLGAMRAIHNHFFGGESKAWGDGFLTFLVLALQDRVVCRKRMLRGQSAYVLTLLCLSHVASG